MANKKFIVKLSGEERAQLTGLISKGKAAAKTLLKARILLKADQGKAGEGWLDGKFARRSIHSAGLARARDVRQPRARCGAYPQAAGNPASCANL